MPKVLLYLYMPKVTKGCAPECGRCTGIVRALQDLRFNAKFSASTHRMQPSYSVYQPVGAASRALCGAQQRDWVRHSQRKILSRPERSFKIRHFLTGCYLRPKWIFR
jgi:hypothetical protein